MPKPPELGIERQLQSYAVEPELVALVADLVRQRSDGAEVTLEERMEGADWVLDFRGTGVLLVAAKDAPASPAPADASTRARAYTTVVVGS